MPNICADIEGNTTEWEQFYVSIEVKQPRLPKPYDDVDALSRLILFKCLRPDRMPDAIEDIVAEHLDATLIETRCVDVSQAYEQSSAREPIVIIATSDGNDGDELNEFVKRNGFADRFTFSTTK